MRGSNGKTAIVLTAPVLGAGIVGTAAPADNNGSLAFQAFPPDGAVRAGLGAQSRTYLAFDATQTRPRGS